MKEVAVRSVLSGEVKTMTRPLEEPHWTCVDHDERGELRLCKGSQGSQ